MSELDNAFWFGHYLLSASPTVVTVEEYSSLCKKLVCFPTPAFRTRERLVIPPGSNTTVKCSLPDLSGYSLLHFEQTLVAITPEFITLLLYHLLLSFISFPSISSPIPSAAFWQKLPASAHSLEPQPYHKMPEAFRSDDPLLRANLLSIPSLTLS